MNASRVGCRGRAALAGLAGLLVAGSALAAKPDLEATGNTVGGPALLEVPSGASRQFYTRVFPASPDLCLTFVNVGKEPVTPNLGGVSTQPVDPGDAQSLCAIKPTTGTFQCGSLSGKDCEVAWRLDLL